MVEPTPAHTIEHEELAALHALEVLDDAELAAYAPHLVACDTCQGLLAANQQVAQQLAVLAPEAEVAPPAELRARVLARARAELDADAAPTATRAAREPAATARGSWWDALSELFGVRQPWAVPVAMGALAAMVVALLFGLPAYENQVIATVPLRGNADGTARVLVHRSGAASLELQGLAAPPPDHVYEAWVIPADGQPIPAGATNRGEGTLALTARVMGNAVVAITVEPAPGGSKPSSQPILVGRVEVV